MQGSHLPQRKAFTGCMITKDAATISIHEMHFPYVLWMKLLATGPKMAQWNESGYVLYFQTMFSSEPVLTEGAARQQCLLTHFLYMFGQSLNPPEISWRTLTVTPTKQQRGCSSQFSLTILSCSPNVSQLGKKTSLTFRREKTSM